MKQLVAAPITDMQWPRYAGDAELAGKRALRGCLLLHYVLQRLPSVEDDCRVSPGRSGPSHVVSHVDGIQLVGQERVPEVHALLLPPGVDGNHPGVHDDHHAYDEVVLLQHHVGY